MPRTTARDLVVAITPFREPRADLVVAVERAGHLGVLDLGTDESRARAALSRVCGRWAGPFGARITGDCPVSPASLPAEVDTLIIDLAVPAGSWQDIPQRVLAEVTSPDEAREAARRGAHGLIARGSETGGRIGELSAFVLLQRLAAEFSLPVWAMGGIGEHTAAAAVAGGARGVVLDAQLALAAEADLPADVAAAIRAMDGSETRVTGGYRVYTRPDLPAIEPGPGRLGGHGLREQLLPVGQDGAFATRLAARYRTAGGVVTAIGSAITAQIALADRIRPLSDAVPVQGPMTRVSDRPQFAAEVAAAGGLPFLALALMPGDEVRHLLAETGARIAGRRPWGVGILGFAPAELREAQLAAILEARPPCALIAGGRPSQAAALERAGIETFLHVPSPGLLEQFVAAGSRRFVFEGAECGGHIGPRGSFALWEAQISLLLERPDLDGFRVLFAGGVHDRRSAAMVAAMAAPLAERGARVGVLMGTAYLFTAEAVRSGAILPGYQQSALSCTATALLETSPGHVTRCADTPYVAAFEEARLRLTAEGVPPQQAWAELEQLNLGRLRIAAKGLRRDGDNLITVDAQTAYRDGMVMLGQVATMRSEVTTVTALHREVSTEAGEFLAARAQELTGSPAPDASPVDVAIVGMACVYPGADGLGAFWANVVSGADAITGVPAERWRAETYPDLPARGGFLPRVPFDALSYGIPPSSLGSIDPVQLLALEVAARALADAGYSGRPFTRDRTSVIFGAEAGSDLASAYGLRSVLPAVAGEVPGELDAYLPRLTEDSFPGVLSNVIAGRIANRLDLGGVNYTVDAACASSLAALDLACKELATGSSDMVLCGGADTHNGVHDYEMFSSVHALSPQGRCATFDVSGDGIALGEGAACVVLKRLADAERDGDRVYAVIKAVAGSSDGRSLGLTAPRPEGQRRALDRAYAAAGVSPAEVGLIEAHGTGTVVGDRTELATATEVFTEAGARPASCTIGSVKSQIGHTKCAAGLAGLIKAALAVHTGVRPGTIHLTEPNPAWDPASSPFTFTAAGQARPWAAPSGSRHAGVSAFGFGGTNFHAVLSGYDGADEPVHGLREWPAELFVFRGDAEAAAGQLRQLIADNEAAGRPWRLAQLAATMAAGSEPIRAALVATDLDDLTAKLREPFGEPQTAGELAFLFPGQGSQRPGMLADLFAAFPRLQRLLRLSDGRYADVMFPPAAFTREERDRRLAAISDTRNAQPALGIAGLALHELLGALGVRPGLVGGHSYGELLALCAAGCYDESDLLDLSEIRATAILEAVGDDPGTMAAVTAPPDQVRRLLNAAGAAEVVLANHNSPGQVVISGPTAAVDAATAALDAAGLSAQRIPVACAFHSPVVAAAAGKLAAELAARDIRAPRLPVFANATATTYPADPEAVREILADQVARPVRFAEQVEAMYQAGARTFVEVGPGRVLTGLVGKILADRPHTAVACDVPGENGLVQLLTAVARLIRAGVAVDPAFLFAGRAEAVSGTPARPQWTVDGQIVRTADGRPIANGLQPALAAPLLTAAAGEASAPLSDRDRIVAEFLRTTRELVAAQRDVMLGYLGAAPASAAPLPAPAAPAPLTPVPLTSPVPAPANTAATSPMPANTASASPAGPPSRADIGEAVVDVVSARTGYPRDMLGTDLDLEADLSIDSIKRTEIIGALAERLGLATDASGIDESVVAELARLKTIGGIADWLAAHIGAAAAPARPETRAEEARPVEARAEPETSPEPEAAPESRAARNGRAAASAGEAGPRTAAPGRYLVEDVEIGPVTGGAEPSGPVLIVDDGRGIALELADLLEQRAVKAVIVEAPSQDQLADCGGVVHLGALRPGAGPVLPDGFGQFRDALVRDGLAGPVSTLLVATATGGTFGQDYRDAPGEGSDLGLRGLIRTIAAEYPQVLVRAVDVEPKESPRVTAAQLLAELTDADGPVVVGYRGGRRRGLRVRRAERPEPQPEGLGLDRDSVVLLTGGARGITAQAALALASATGCHIELLGRTPVPGTADPQLEAAADPADLRRLLIERGMRSPREIEAAAGRITAEAQMRATLARLRAVAASVRYHCADVRDAAAVGAVIDDIYARHGQLDGVIHGAGLTEDRLVPDKTPESFARVYATKVDGARALRARLRSDIGFLVLFGSVSGVFGNRGQADYSAGNDALDTLAHLWSPGLPGRVVSLDWGPWAGGAGLVTPELEREYARRGITLIDPEAGVAGLLAELAAGRGPAQVIYMCGDPGDG
jgi:acyl transferase domain-containing protein/NAD(P)H-dependent flavin oxidoreductase YrpB (nitropropane dioxygenase family)